MTSAQSNAADDSEVTRYFQVTPAGAFYATMDAEAEAMRVLLQQLLSADTPVPYMPGLMSRLTGLDQHAANELLEEMQHRALLSLVENPQETVTGPLEKILGELIEPLGEGKVLLADQQGFALANSGFSPEEGEAVAALAGDLMALNERHASLIGSHLELSGCSWAMVNAVGQSELGFWVLGIGREKFLLIIEGMPYLNRQAFVDLASVLIRRYLDNYGNSI